MFAQRVTNLKRHDRRIIFAAHGLVSARNFRDQRLAAGGGGSIGNIGSGAFAGAPAAATGAAAPGVAAAAPAAAPAVAAPAATVANAAGGNGIMSGFFSNPTNTMVAGNVLSGLFSRSSASEAANANAKVGDRLFSDIYSSGQANPGTADYGSGRMAVRPVRRRSCGLQCVTVKRSRTWSARDLQYGCR